MKLSALIESDVTAESAGDLDVAGLTADSRLVEPGFVFAALPGVVTDGARYAAEAAKRGAVAILAARDAALDEIPPAMTLRADNPRHTFAVMAARFYAPQPGCIAAVTGTNGKTSVASFLEQIWALLGHSAASMGTLGVSTPGGLDPLLHTTPDPVKLHQVLQGLARENITHVALEASSHGLAQSRLDGVVLTAAGFTNISRDHLDYHASFEDYFSQKARLFTDVLPAGGTAVVFADTIEAAQIADLCNARGLTLFSVGEKGRALQLLDRVPGKNGQSLTLKHAGRSYQVDLPLVGDFQAANVMVAAGLAIACGGDRDAVFASLPKLKGPRGRLERVAVASNGASVFVDYAHTPDALETALQALRPYTGGRLALVFGCGGDRDKGKRPQMGAVAGANADLIYVSDDNPRNEDPAQIRSEILAACPNAQEIGDRQQAISEAISNLASGDVLLVAGKGHETGQIIRGTVHPFSDHDVVNELIGGSR